MDTCEEILWSEVVSLVDVIRECLIDASRDVLTGSAVLKRLFGTLLEYVTRTSVSRNVIIQLTGETSNPSLNMNISSQISSSDQTSKVYKSLRVIKLRLSPDKFILAIFCKNLILTFTARVANSSDGKSWRALQFAGAHGEIEFGHSGPGIPHWPID
ncbi:hypothetical protein Btru_034433 [Bulinus truncatus]|nr:hypothetical protein Btru_034433 [Bulinus truncatus]